MSARRDLSGARSTIDLCEQWIAGRSHHTARAYWGDLAWWAEQLGALDLAALTLGDVAAVLDQEHDLARSTLARRVATLRALCRYAHRAGFVERDLSALIRAPRADGGALASRIIDAGSVMAMFAATSESRTPERDRLALRVLYYSGARAAELAGLEWRDVRRRGERAWVTFRAAKGGQSRTVALPAPVARDLAHWREAHGARRARGAVFLSRTGRPLTERDIHRIVRRTAAAAGLAESVSPHWLRHAHATHAIERGAPLHVVAATLGHASLATTTRYLHARPGESSGDYLG